MKNKLIQHKTYLLNKLKDIRSQLATLPPGKLIVAKDRNHTKWYVSDGKNKQYLHKNKKDIAEKLAIKKYLLTLQEDLELELRFTEKHLNNSEMQASNAEKLLLENSEISDLLSTYFKPMSKKLDEWTKAPYEKSQKYPNDLKHKLNNKEIFRSKSEVMIAQTLKMNRIPYRYEEVIELDGVDFAPDFTILHPRTGKLFYWEHCGMVDSPKYQRSTLSKLRHYMENGIIPGENLILTFETEKTPLSMEQVEFLVQFYFL